MGLREEVDQLIADIKADGERMQKRMKEAAERGAAAVAAEKERWRQIELRREAEREGAREAARATHVRETPPDDAYGDRFERFEKTLNAIAQDVGQLKTDVGQLKTDVGVLKTEVKERLATRVELEELSHKIVMMADGFTETQRRLSYVADLLKRNVIAP